MKKSHRLVSMALIFAMCASMCIPVFAQEPLPPGVSEDELWFPSNGIILLEEPNAACGLTSHRPPTGYTYVGYSSGDSSVEMVVADGLTTLIAFIPGLGWVSTAFLIANLTITMQEYLDHGQVLTTYNKYIWGNGQGSYWYHIVWAADSDGDGQKEYITCEVQTYP